MRGDSRLLALGLLGAARAAALKASSGQTQDQAQTQTTSFATTSEEDKETLRQRQLTALRVCGWLALLLYVLLSLAITWRTVLHFLYSSRGAKKVFHVTLLVSALLQLPEAIEWIWYPTEQSWEAMYVFRLYSLLLLSFCKSYLAICWAGVVSAGQRTERRRMTKLVTVLNALLVLWGVLVPILLSGYADNVYGQYKFMSSTLRGVLTYSGVIVVLAYGVLLGYQGFRLRRRLLMARGTVPASSVEKSLNQLMLAIFIFIFSDVVRLLALVLNEADAAMSMIVYLALYNLIPQIFPTVCMLYLMRRVTSGNSGASDVGVSHMKALNRKRTLSKYMTEADSDDSSRGSTGSDSGGNTYAIQDRRAEARARLDLQAQQYQDELQTSRDQQQLPSPAFCWVRESTELR